MRRGIRRKADAPFCFLLRVSIWAAVPYLNLYARVRKHSKLDFLRTV